ncbi:MAG: YeeE/YedE family protein [Tissierellia bacterium]|nr:YeeE/YedE family protein [Tissierellia bacterium]
MTKTKNWSRLLQGLIIGILFGFLLQKGGVSKYDIIIGQLRLTDFTVIKIILTAIVVTMLGISFFYPKGKIEVKTKSGSIKNATIGGLLFGIGFGVLGYCPGTIAGAIGNGYIDAMTGGLIGILLGTVIFAMFYSKLKDKKILTTDKYSEFSLFHSFKGNPFKYTIPISIFIIFVMYLIQVKGL